MHFPRMSSELLMFPASFSRSPMVLALLQRSEPARSHRENLRTKQAHKPTLNSVLLQVLMEEVALF